MSKALKIAAVVVGVAAITVATFGIGAVTVGAAAAAAQAGVVGVTTAGASLFGLSAGPLMLASSALSLASGLTAKKPSISSAGSQTAFKADPDAGIPYAIGRTASGGNIIYRGNSDGWSNKTPNDLSDFVVIDSLGPIQGYESFTADQTAYTFDGSGNAIGAYHDFMFLKSQLGATPEATSLAVTAGISSRPAGWATSAKLSGLAGYQWRLRFDSKGDHYQGGTMRPRRVLLGLKVYDPRLDSTYPGGSGSCRANDEATWVYSQRPHLHALTWLIGRRQNGQRVMGVGIPISAIDVAAYVEGANIDDANDWKVGGIVSSSDSKWEVLKAILQAGSSEPLRLGARVGCLVNTPRVSLATIGIDDLAQGEVSVQATQRQRERINGIIPRYRSEDHDWEIVPGAPVRVAAHVTEDGGRRTKEVEYPLVQVEAGQPVVQPAQLARYDIENAREFGPISIPLKLRWMGYRPGDCITANLPESNLNNQTILLLNRGLDPGSAVVTITARSETAAKHAFALGQTTTPPPTASVTGPPLVPTPASGDWAITALSISSGGVTVPALTIEGVAPTSVENIVFDYRIYTGPGMDPEAGWIGAGIEPSLTTKKTISSVQSGTDYQVSVRYRLRGATSASRLILGPSTSGTYAGVAGGTGPAGLSVATVKIYKRAASTPALPTTTGTFTFATNAITGLDNGWTIGVPAANGQPLWVSAASAVGSGSTDTIAAGEWAAAVIEAQDGATGATGGAGSPGANTATVFLYQRTTTATPPSVPAGTLTYTFASASLSGTLGSWAQSLPITGGEYRWLIQATALGTGATDTIASGEWATPAILAEDGDTGVSAKDLKLDAASITIDINYDGSPKPGQIGKKATLRLFDGDTDVTGSASWSRADSATVTTSEATTSSGREIAIGALTATGTTTVTATYAGIAYQKVLQWVYNKDAAPPSSPTSQSVTVTSGSNLTTVPIAPNMNGTVLLAANGSGQLTVTILTNYYALPVGGTNKTWTGKGLAFYRLPGGSWTAFGAAVDGSTAISDSSPGGDGVSPGQVYLNQTASGLTAGTVYEVGGALYKGSGNNLDYNYGTITVSQ
jgi:trimeric autotransporter adhesin